MQVKEIAGTPGDIKGCYADTSKIRKLLKFKPKFSFIKGIREFKYWADSN